MTTPLMQDIVALRAQVYRIVARRRLDDLDYQNPLVHISVIGVFHLVYSDPEMLAQIEWTLKPKSKGSGFDDN